MLLTPAHSHTHIYAHPRTHTHTHTYTYTYKNCDPLSNGSFASTTTQHSRHTRTHTHTHTHTYRLCDPLRKGPFANTTTQHSRHPPTPHRHCFTPSILKFIHILPPRPQRPLQQPARTSTQCSSAFYRVLSPLAHIHVPRSNRESARLCMPQHIQHHRALIQHLLQASINISLHLYCDRDFSWRNSGLVFLG